MTESRSNRRLTPIAIVAALALLLLPAASGCLVYKVYSAVKTVDKVKDFTEDHILKNHDDDDKDKDKD